MTALTFGIKAWATIRSVEMRKIDKVQRKALKMIFKLPVSTAYTSIPHKKINQEEPRLNLEFRFISDLAFIRKVGTSSNER